jgi:hypothetical protein
MAPRKPVTKPNVDVRVKSAVDVLKNRKQQLQNQLDKAMGVTPTRIKNG